MIAGIGGFATGRFTTPDEVATLVAILASQRTANVTGANYVIDGGLINRRSSSCTAHGPTARAGPASSGACRTVAPPSTCHPNPLAPGLAGRVARVIGIDDSAGMLAVAERASAGSMSPASSLRQGDIAARPLADDSVDVAPG